MEPSHLDITASVPPIFSFLGLCPSLQPSTIDSKIYQSQKMYWSQTQCSSHSAWDAKSPFKFPNCHIKSQYSYGCLTGTGEKNTWKKWASLIRQSQGILIKEVMRNEVLGNVTALTTAHNVAKKDKKPGALRRKEDDTFQIFKTPYLMHRILRQTLFFRDFFFLK